MAVTKQDQDTSNQEFGAAFAEEGAAPVEQTEDEAFGLSMPADVDSTATQGDGETDAGEAVVTGAGEGEVPAPEVPAEPAAATDEAPVVEEGTQAEAMAAAGEDDMPPMTQAEKSWEGRLRKREEELKALAAELEARKNSPAEPSEEAGESPAEAATDADDESGEIDPDEAMRQLSEDFGPRFVKMIVAIAGKTAVESAGSRVDELGRTLEDVIGDIKNSRARRHFKEIHRMHPDFVEVSESDGFKGWIGALAPELKTEADRVIAAGDSDEINDLLTRFKQSAEQGEVSGPNESEIEAAEGVRSTGIRLPDAPPAGKDDFAAAWDAHS